MVGRAHELDPGLLDRRYIPFDRQACADFVLQYGLPEVEVYRHVNPQVAEAIASEIADRVYVAGRDVVQALVNYVECTASYNAAPSQHEVPTVYIANVRHLDTGRTSAVGRSATRPGISA